MDALRWHDGRFAGARVEGLPGSFLEVDAATDPHPLFGAAHALLVEGARVAWLGALDWARPTTIPPIDAPARLPALTGTALLNAIAAAAAAAGVPALRYAGPYPTAALWASLAQCFGSSGTEAEFTADAEARALAVTMTPVPVDFAPAPFSRRWIGARVATQARAELERVFVDGLAYVAASAAPHRLVPADDGWACELWLGDAPWARVVELDATGALRRGPDAPPPLRSAVLGAELPRPLRAALAGLIADTLAARLASAVHDELDATPIIWGETGLRLVEDRATHLVLHAGLWERLAPLGAARLALALAQALAPPLAARAQGRLARAMG